mgnify:CR=1 FL=1
MRIPGQVIFGILIILIGLMFLFGNLFDVDVGALCFPTALILVGVWRLPLLHPGSDHLQTGRQHQQRLHLGRPDPLHLLHRNAQLLAG